MASHDNKEMVRYWFEEVVNGKTDRSTLLAEMERVISPAFVDHDGPDPTHGRAALERALPMLLTALPDARFIVEKAIAEGDLVAVRVRGEATHTGVAMGIPPTGKRITWTENEIFRFEDGRAVESWGEGSLDEALAQIGFGFRAKAPVAAERSRNPILTIGSVTFELLDESEGTSTIRASVPPVTTYMATVHKHPSAEEIEVVSGRLRLTHGDQDPLRVDELGPGERMAGGPNEWHGIANASTSEPLVVLLRHTPGHQWAEFVRQGAAAVERLGKLPDGFVQAQFQDIGVVAKR